jgi:ADP-heptose:LPS heptosyltransferase
MREILVVNLTRMGDLIQTTPVMAALRESHPGARITLLVNAVFAEICRDIPFIDRLMVFDKPAFRKMIRGEEHTLVECFRSLESFIDGVNDTTYDLAINFTPSGESAVLTSLFQARETRGVTAGADGSRIIRHPWQRYFMNVIPSRNYNPFHLCDMMVKAAGVRPAAKGLHLSVTEEGRRNAAATLREHGIGEEDLLVGFQLGASHPVKTWPAASFARVADMLSESLGARVLLTGDRQEAALGGEFESLATQARTANLIGKTDLRAAAALLGRCALFVSNDTGPLHIATAVGTPSLNLSLGHVCFRETGPYGEGHYVVEPDAPCRPCGFHVECRDPRCKGQVTPESVFELARKILAEGVLGPIEDGPLWRGVRVYRSGFAGDGLVDYVPLIRRPLGMETFYTYLYRETWPHVLDGTGGFAVDRARAVIEAKAAAWHGEGELERCVGNLGEDLETLRRMEAAAGEAENRVSLIAREARKASPDTEWIRGIWKEVPGLDREIETLGRTHPPLMPPVTLFRFGKEALEGEELAPMAESALGLYSALRSHLSMLEGMIGALVEKGVKAQRSSCHT